MNNKKSLSVQQLVLYPKCKVSIDKGVGIISSINFLTDACSVQIEYGEDKLPQSFIRNVNEIKPILLPLSSMNDEQANRIASMALDSYLMFSRFRFLFKFGILPKGETPFAVKKYIYDTDKTETGTKGIWKVEIEIPKTKILVHIWEDFNIQVTNEEEAEISKQAEIFQYLLSEQFDIFDWIGSGMALDKTHYSKQT